MRIQIAAIALALAACGPASPHDPSPDAGVPYVAPTNIWPEPGPAVMTLNASDTFPALHSATLPTAPGPAYAMQGRARRVSFGSPGAGCGFEIEFLDGATPPNVLAKYGQLATTSASWVTPYTRTGGAPAGTVSVRFSAVASPTVSMEYADVLAQRLP